MANHEEQDRQSLMLHTEAVRMMQDDPSLIDRALGILDRWESARPHHPSHAEWRRILLERDWEAALSISDLGQQLRQSSPMSRVLPEEKRLEVVWKCRGDKSGISKEEWLAKIREANEKLLAKNYFV